MGEAKRKNNMKPMMNEKAVKEAARRDAMLVNMSGRRVGRIYFMVKDMEDSNKLQEIQYVIQVIGFVPIRVECRMDIQQYEMVGYCVQFDRVPLGQAMPVYQLVVEDNGATIKAIRADQMEAYQKAQKGLQDEAAMTDEVDVTLLDKDGNQKPN